MRSKVEILGANTLLLALVSLLWYSTSAQGERMHSKVLPFESSATLRAFEVDAGKEAGAQVRWETSFETGYGSFRLLSETATGVWVLAAPPVAMQGEDGGARYCVRDPRAYAGARVHYALEFADRSGETVRLTEWQGVVPAVAPETTAGVMEAEPDSSSGASVTEIEPPPPQYWIGNAPRVRAWDEGQPADRVRLSLTSNGVYRVTAAELATAGGWLEGTVATAIANTNIALTCQGNPVAWLRDDNAIVFYGEAPDSMYAPENVYWVELAPGLAMSPRADAFPQAPITNTWFRGTSLYHKPVSFVRNGYSTITNASQITSTTMIAYGANRVLPIALPDAAPGLWEGHLTANLLSYHTAQKKVVRHAMLSSDTTTLGTTNWTGELYFPLMVPYSSSDVDGDIMRLTISNITDDGYEGDASFLCVTAEATYHRLLRARSDELACASNVGNVHSIGGFTTNDLIVLEIGSARMPRVVQTHSLVWSEAENEWTVTFADADEDASYYALSISQAARAPSVRGVRDIDWGDAAITPYVILVPPEAWRGDYRAAMQPLADYRTTHGLAASIVDVESLYNTFSHGLVDPVAIQRFCGVGYPHGLRYLLLAGSGSLDTKHFKQSVNDQPACLIPSLIAGQGLDTGEGMTVVLDPLLGDGDGDGLPDVAVGRLPTTSPAEMTTVISKTIGYETGKHWRQPVELVADWKNTGEKFYDFAAAAERLVTPLTALGRTYSRHYLPAQNTGTSTRNNSLLPAFHAGTAIFYYIGHSNEQNMGHQSDWLLSVGHISAGNWTQPNVAIVMSCRNNRWQYISTTRALLPTGLFKENTGFVASIGSTGNLLTDEGDALGLAIFGGNKPPRMERLGDMLLRGLRNPGHHYAIPADRLMSVSLIGDPALRVDVDPTMLIIIR